MIVLISQLSRSEFQLSQSSLDDVDFLRHAVHLHRQTRCGFVDQIDGFIRQKPIGDVTTGKLSGCNQCRIFDRDAVVSFIALFKSSQDRDRVFDVWLVDINGLKATFEGCVFFNVLAIFIQRRGADAMQLAAGKRWLKQIRCIAAAFSRTGSNDGVKFVNEEYDLSGGGGDFFEHRLESIFEFAAEFCSRDQRSHVQCHDAFIAQALRNVVVNDT